MIDNKINNNQINKLKDTQTCINGPILLKYLLSTKNLVPNQNLGTYFQQKISTTEKFTVSQKEKTQLQVSSPILFKYLLSTKNSRPNLIKHNRFPPIISYTNNCFDNQPNQFTPYQETLNDLNNNDLKIQRMDSNEQIYFIKVKDLINKKIDYIYNNN